MFSFFKVCMLLFIVRESIAYDNRLSYKERVEFLIVHNEFRSNSDPPAANMQLMIWDEELAELAQEWADNCHWEHGQPTKKSYKWKGMDQNLYTSIFTSFNPRKVVKSWYDEINDYSYSSNTCKPGRVCGHYTQVVWHDSIYVGCAVADCDDLANSKWTTKSNYVVCNYAPAGNWIGVLPYTEGARCSGCSKGYKCRKGLCVKRGKICGSKSCHHGAVLDKVCECVCPEGYTGYLCDKALKGDKEDEDGGDRHKPQGNKHDGVHDEDHDDDNDHAPTTERVTTKPARKPTPTTERVTTKPAKKPTPAAEPVTTKPDKKPAPTTERVTTKPAKKPTPTKEHVTTKPAKKPAPTTERVTTEVPNTQPVEMPAGVQSCQISDGELKSTERESQLNPLKKFLLAMKGANGDVCKVKVTVRMAAQGAISWSQVSIGKHPKYETKPNKYGRLYARYFTFDGNDVLEDGIGIRDPISVTMPAEFTDGTISVKIRASGPNSYRLDVTCSDDIMTLETTYGGNQVIVDSELAFYQRDGWSGKCFQK